MARVTIALLGWTFDWSIEPTAAEVEDDGPRDLGYTNGTFLSFTSGHDIPEEAAVPMRCNGWPDEE